MRVIAGAYERTAFDVPKPHFTRDGLELVELSRLDVTLDSLETE